ncbi:MAG: hypothetical protein IT286_00585 [Proteobacteria bacterium]|jgi:hypothetical protein|nr:hypothetical protein [Pseudomonadota bacterium]
MARGRDYAMAISGAIIVGAGVTFVIKSGKTPPKDSSKVSKIELKAWNPASNPMVNYDPIRR